MKCYSDRLQSSTGDGTLTMSLFLRNFQRKVVFNEPLFRLHCNLLLHLFGAWIYDLNIVCVADTEIQHLNKRYRGIDAPTDVLSFAYHEVIFINLKLFSFLVYRKCVAYTLYL